MTPSQPRLVRKALIYLFATLAGVVILFPYLWMALASFQSEIDVTTLPPFPLKAVQFTLDNYRYTLTVLVFPKALFDSAIVAICSTLLVLTISAWAGYTLSKIRFRGRNLLYSLLIVLYMIPGLPMLIPLIILFKEFHMLDTLPALILSHGILLIPLMTWFLVGVFDSVPKDLDDAAQADGMGRLATIMRVNMPLAKTGLALILVFTFTISWNELLFSNTVSLVNTPMLQPVILDYSLGSVVQFNGAAAGGVLSSLPIIILALILQRYIISGIMKGAVK